MATDQGPLGEDDIKEYEKSQGRGRQLIFFVVIAGSVGSLFWVFKKISLIEPNARENALIEHQQKLLDNRPAPAALPDINLDEEYLDTQPLSSSAILAKNQRVSRLCDHDLNYAIGEIIFKNSRFDPLEEFYLEVKRDCGEDIELRWLVFSGAKRQGDFKQAERLVSAMIAEFPEDKDYLVWRGMLYAQYKFTPQAIADFEAAIRLVPELRDLPVELAALYEKIGDSCGAVKTIDRYVLQYPDILVGSSLSDKRKRYLIECNENRKKGPI